MRAAWLWVVLAVAVAGWAALEHYALDRLRALDRVNEDEDGSSDGRP